MADIHMMQVGIIKNKQFSSVIGIIQSFGCLNSSPPGQNGRHFADDIFRCNFVNEKFCILI